MTDTELVDLELKFHEENVQAAEKALHEARAALEAAKVRRAMASIAAQRKAMGLAREACLKRQTQKELRQEIIKAIKAGARWEFV